MGDGRRKGRREVIKNGLHKRENGEKMVFLACDPEEEGISPGG